VARAAARQQERKFLRKIKNYAKKRLIFKNIFDILIKRLGA